LAFLAGGLLTHAWDQNQATDCRYHIRENTGLEVIGRVEGRVVGGRGEVVPGAGGAGGCDLPLRFVLSGKATRAIQAFAPDDPEGDGVLSIPAGSSVRLQGRWRRGQAAEARDPIRAGYLRVEDLALREDPDSDRWDVGRWAGWVQSRLGALFPNEGALVEALVLARKESLPPALRESFARAGTAHLLAISGFHVGVVAGLLLLAGGWVGLPYATRFLLGSAGVWGYVLFIGLPDAALRAALILTVLALGRSWGRAVAPLGVLASAFLWFLVTDPGALLRPGFQLSFAGALGLVSWARPLSRRLSEGPGPRLPPVLASGVAAGVSATLATLPIVAWHFGRVSVVGIPLTLLVAPLVALAIPGIFLSLFASTLNPHLGAFLAIGVEATVTAFSGVVEWAGALPFASVWVSRPGVMAGCAGVAAAMALARVRPALSPGGRRTILLVGACSGVLLWPVAAGVAGRGVLELVVLDVGQGDALLLRSPRGRWILVDAGPKSESFDAGARIVLPYLRRRGVRNLDLLILTHPDMDHVGGAGAILREFPVRGVLDPGMAVGTEVFLDALEGARENGVPWAVGTAGDSLDLDGIALRVLWPRRAEIEPDSEPDLELVDLLAEEGANGASVVLEIRYGDFAALLTGDAPAAVEEEILPRVLSPGVRVIKVGHHGSRSSTSPELLERISPDLAVISVGRRNRYGHPHDEVLRRLESEGVRILRTDRNGIVSIRAREDGGLSVRVERGA
jgi:competence protein ComEC